MKLIQKLGEDFAKFCGLLRIYELYVVFTSVMPEPGGPGKSNKGLPDGLDWLSCLSGSTKSHRGKMFISDFDYQY